VPADHKLWLSQVEHEGPLRSGGAELFDRKDEMMKCETVDPGFYIFSLLSQLAAEPTSDS